jgi:hypothetical protein
MDGMAERYWSPPRAVADRRRELKRSLWAAIMSVIESGLRLLAAVCVEAADVNVRTFVAGIDETPVAGAPTSSESVR